MIHRENIEWSDVWVEAADTTLLPRVLIVGDSIVRSYYPDVSQCLAGKFACARLATSTCVCDPRFLKEIGLVLSEYEFAFIHFNNGLHGWNYNEDEYAEGLLCSLDSVAATNAGARLILATTTPMWQPGRQGVLNPETDRVLHRNRIATDLAATRGIVINDLYGAVINHPDYISEDGVHFKPEGQSALGQLVARVVLEQHSLVTLQSTIRHA